MRRALCLALAVAATAGCARPPAVLRGEFPPVSPRDVQAGARIGERVRWGGEIVSTSPRARETCFEVVAKPLDRQARPLPVDETTGRFIACAAGFYDPAVWAPTREMSVVGAVEAMEQGTVGEATYVYPRVRAAVAYLWPERPPLAPVVYYDPWPGPFWAPYPYFHWYGAGSVVHHRRPHGHRRR